MTASTHPAIHSAKTLPFSLLFVGASALCVVSASAEAGGWRSHGTDAALEAGQLFAPPSTSAALEMVDAVRDTAATASGVMTAASVTGSSGPVILGNLATAGGPVAAGALSGFGVAGLQNKYLYSDCENVDACDAAAIAGYAGAGAGVAGATALGAAYGVGASGLATIGGMVGGGMAAGAVGLIALPAVTAVAIGAGVYGIVSLFSD
ncbi:MAG: hypothetical protein VBE63_17180 [Lamprobacter sp.]|uniref:hypothetical protein n=1 Tax=Lamprobacter sp. TaxID=3100796 RepID=UPI002B256ECC|nr:hypothetical protein [Lamprobacter sp.]MEA3641655.1 hypothetical protein [Lamprobacter sp.]